MSRLSRVALMLTALVLVGCNGDGDKKTMRATTPAMDDSTFMTRTAQMGVAEVQLSQIATQRASDPQVKQFAQRMVQDHTQANRQLTQVASGMNMRLPTTADREHQQLATNLQRLSGREFDRQYMSNMVRDHERLLSMLQQQSRAGQSSQLRNWVDAQIPIVQDHLQMARDLNQSLQGGSSGSGYMGDDSGTHKPGTGSPQ